MIKKIFILYINYKIKHYKSILSINDFLHKKGFDLIYEENGLVKTIQKAIKKRG